MSRIILCILFLLLHESSCENTSDSGLTPTEYDTYEYEYLNGNFSYDSNSNFNYPLYIANYSFTKCTCSPLQAWNGTACISINEEFLIGVLQKLRLDTGRWLDNYQTTVEISERSCFSNEKQIAIKEIEFYLTQDGHLYHKKSDMLFSKDQFCLEFLAEKNDSILIEALLCLPQPKLSICCDRGAYCNEIVTDQALSVQFGDAVIDWEMFDFITVDNLICNKNEMKKSFNLSAINKTLTFEYITGEIHPVWSGTSHLYDNQHLNKKKYCFLSGYKLQVGELCYFDAIANHEKQCNSSTCVRKCCPGDQAFDLIQRKCAVKDSKLLWQKQFYDVKTKAPTNPPENLLMEYGNPLCSLPNSFYLLDPQVNEVDEFFLLQNGTLFISHSNIAVPPSKYCIDNFIISENDFSVKSINCFQDEPEKKGRCEDAHSKGSPLLIVLSCLFLTLTLIVYTAVPELHAKLHGKSLISHVTSLLTAYLCQLIVSWSSKSLSMTGCQILALCNQVSFLWAFFWLNVMCFDIWWTLKSMCPSPETGEDSRRRFALYSMYAWGCPLIITFITATMEFLPNDVPTDGLILPGFGIRGCWFQDEAATWVYFYGFTLVLYVFNIVFFCHVAAILIMGQRSTQGILRTTRKQQTERVVLYLKFFVVMGITWICEVISWQEGTCSYWLVTDFINSAQGVFIFIIFMCNRKVLEKVKAKGQPMLRRLKTFVSTPSSALAPVGKPSNSSSSQRTTQTSVGSSSRSRRLSTSSGLQPCDTAQVSLSSLANKKKQNRDTLEKETPFCEK